jgi:hypothetical protein
MAATRAAWSRLQTYDVTSEGNTTATVSSRRRSLPVLNDRTPVQGALRAGREEHTGPYDTLGRLRSEELSRLRISSIRIEAEASRGPCRRCTDRVRVKLRRRHQAPEPDGKHCHGRRHRCESQARPPHASYLDGSLQTRKWRLPDGLCQAAGLSMEGAARLAACEMRPQQGSLKVGELGIELGRCPLAGTLTIPRQNPHNGSDGGGDTKLVLRRNIPRRSEDQKRDWRVSMSTPIMRRMNPRLTMTAE